ncbi:MAG: transcriptional repressor [Clostridiales bacterium]|nr:transcriptional repressor [Clostridiales bacterium]
MDTVNMLNEKKIKTTKYRIEILDFLIKEENRFISIDEIQEKVSSDFSTAYRALELFEENNFIYKTKIKEKFYYTYRCDEGKNHHHLICTECGLKIVLDFCPFETLEKKYYDLGFDSFYHSRDFFGVCQNCKDQNIID